MNWRFGVSLPSFSYSTTWLILLIFRRSSFVSPSSRLSFPPPLASPPPPPPSSLPYTSTPIPYVHHPVSDSSSNHCVPSTSNRRSRSASAQQPAFQGFESSIAYVSDRPRDSTYIAHPALRLAQSSPFNHSPHSSPSRAIANDSPDDFQTNAASFISPTPSTQSDSTIPPNVYINGLPPNFPEEQLYNMTKEFGTVLSVRTFTRHVSERPTQVSSLATLIARP